MKKRRHFSLLKEGFGSGTITLSSLPLRSAKTTEELIENARQNETAEVIDLN